MPDADSKFKELSSVTSLVAFVSKELSSSETLLKLGTVLEFTSVVLLEVVFVVVFILVNM